jgi:hypothetical protein
LPNDIGNSNGELPTSPLGTTLPRPSFLRRAVGAILPTHYVRVPTHEPPTGVRGGGIQNDGVFSNVVVKPASSVPTQAEDGTIYMVPEETQSTAPPVRLHSFSNVLHLIVLEVLCGSPSRCCSPVLGYNCARSFRNGY